MNDNEKELVGGGPEIFEFGRTILSFDSWKNGMTKRYATKIVRGTFLETKTFGTAEYKEMAEGKPFEFAGKSSVTKLHTDGKFLIGAIAVVGASALACAGMAIYDACTDE